jgi:DNA polymerase IV
MSAPEIRKIIHIDMDAFYASVEQRDDPELRGKPVAVGGRQRGVVMAASYEARKFGVHSALPLATAHRRCPQMVLLPRDMAHYHEWSQRVMAILREEVPRVEVVGLDEAYLDLGDSDFPKSTCRRVKYRVKEETGLVCSIGLAPNKLLAKIASDLDKPDGFCVLTQEGMLDAVGDRPASLLPGVGPKTFERLRRAGIHTVADLASASDEALGRARLGAELRDRARGIDNRKLHTHRERKSESCETTFAQDVSEPGVLFETLDRLSTRLCASIQRHGYRGRTVTLKIRLRPFRTYTRSKTLESHTADAETVGAVARELLARVELDTPVRLLGIGLAGLERASGDGDDRGLFAEAGSG